MSARTWRGGPPPHVGWWNASRTKCVLAWRWWNGQEWSSVAYEGQSPATARRRANVSHGTKYISWTDYWPENSRVPRLDPTDGHWTFNQGVRPRITSNRLDLVFRDGVIMYHESWGGWEWGQANRPRDIMAWRPS